MERQRNILLICRIANLGPWADYLRSVISQLAPASEISGDLYNNIPLGTDYAFQGASFTIKNALLMVSLPFWNHHLSDANDLKLALTYLASSVQAKHLQVLSVTGLRQNSIRILSNDTILEGFILLG